MALITDHIILAFIHAHLGTRAMERSRPRALKENTNHTGVEMALLLFALTFLKAFTQHLLAQLHILRMHAQEDTSARLLHSLPKVQTVLLKLSATR